MHLSVKNMVCPRCIESVKMTLHKMGCKNAKVDLGTVTTDKPLTEKQLERLKNELEGKGFEIIQDHESEIVNDVKVSIIRYIEHIEENKNPIRLSDFVSNKTHLNYSYVSTIFSEKTGDTIERYFIKMKIERVKELLSFRKWTLSEIANQLKYSSVQYLSNQFKKVTGKTPSQYLKQNHSDRISLDQI